MFLVIDPPRGVPFRGGGVYRNKKWRIPKPIISRLPRTGGLWQPDGTIAWHTLHKAHPKRLV